MRNKVIILLVTMLGSLWNCGYAADEKPESPAVTLAIESICMETNRALFSVAIKNEAKDVLWISKFSLGGAVARAKLTDTYGYSWRAFRPHNLVADPPPFESDYSLRLQPGETMTQSVRSRAVEPTEDKESKRPPNLHPTELKYELLCELSIVSEETGKHRRVLVKTGGVVKVTRP